MWFVSRSECYWYDCRHFIATVGQSSRFRDRLPEAKSNGVGKGDYIMLARLVCAGFRLTIAYKRLPRVD